MMQIARVRFGNHILCIIMMQCVRKLICDSPLNQTNQGVSNVHSDVQSDVYTIDVQSDVYTIDVQSDLYTIDVQSDLYTIDVQSVIL